jgi:hypothetical protein
MFQHLERFFHHFPVERCIDDEIPIIRHYRPSCRKILLVITSAYALKYLPFLIAILSVALGDPTIWCKF